MPSSTQNTLSQSADWLTSAAAMRIPKPAALYVYPFLQTEPADWREADLASLALDGCPLLELVVDCDARDRYSLMLQSKDSVAQLTVWSPRTTGFDLLIAKAGLLLSRIRGGSAGIRDRRAAMSAVPGLATSVGGRRGFSLITACGWSDTEVDVRRHFGVSVRLRSVAASSKPALP